VGFGKSQIRRFYQQAEKWVSVWRHSSENPLTPAPEFFIDNVDRWNGQYETANAIFRKACQGEMDFWATALRPEA
jgi:thiaminase